MSTNWRVDKNIWYNYSIDTQFFYYYYYYIVKSWVSYPRPSGSGQLIFCLTWSQCHTLSGSPGKGDWIAQRCRIEPDKLTKLISKMITNDIFLYSYIPTLSVIIRKVSLAADGRRVKDPQSDIICRESKLEICIWFIPKIWESCRRGREDFRTQRGWLMS